MITKSTVTYLDGRQRTVKNLGWLLRHWRDVYFIEVTDSSNSSDDCLLQAHCDGGPLYETGWADRNVCADWLDRPVFRGLRLDWFGQYTKCGSQETK